MLIDGIIVSVGVETSLREVILDESQGNSCCVIGSAIVEGFVLLQQLILRMIKHSIYWIVECFYGNNEIEIAALVSKSIILKDLVK